MNREKRKNWRWDWLFLFPLALASVFAFFRFPLLQNDDHLEVVRYIADSRAWPPIVADASNQARHTLVYHTLGAVTYAVLKSFSGQNSLLGERSVQALSLLWALGIIPLVWMIGLRIILWIVVILQTAAFWWLLLSGPYYCFQDPWPIMMSP